MPTTQKTLPPGPLRLVRPSTPNLQLKSGELAERLKGHKTSDLWLREGLDEGLDALRSEQLERRAQVADALQQLRDLAVKCSSEDAEHQEALVQAAREGKAQPADDRTSPEQRRALLIAGEERYIAALEVLAETCDKVIATGREREKQVLAQLKLVKIEADDELREAMAKAQAARAGVFQVEMTARWYKAMVDDGVFGGQPAPGHTVAPQRWYSEGDAAFERHWTDAQVEQRQMASKVAERVAEQKRAEAAHAERLAKRDEIAVSALTPERAAS
jgi:hypothetical protein